MPAIADLPRDQVEYLLVDNNSQDQTGQILHQAVEANPQIQLIPLSEAQIQSSYGARNVGIRAARGEFLAFTDADCRPEPQWLSELVKPFADARVGLVAGEIVALPGSSLLEQHADRQDTLSQKHTLAHAFLPYGQTANLGIRRSLLEQVGLFRPYLTTGGDADLCWRVQQQTGCSLHFAEQAIVKHRHRATLKALRSQWHRYGESNQYLHELHNVALMPGLTLGDYLYRLGRWLIKEVPPTGIKMITGQADWVDLLTTPIGLLNVQARSQGQRQAHLPPQAREIPQL